MGKYHRVTEHTCKSGITIGVVYCVYYERHYRKRGLFLQFINHIKILDPNIALATPF